MSYCVVRCWCCTTPCTTLYDASYIPDASGPDALYDTVRRVVRSRRVGPRRLVRRPDASYNAFPTALLPWPTAVALQCLGLSRGGGLSTIGGASVLSGSLGHTPGVQDNRALALEAQPWGSTQGPCGPP